MKRKTTRFLLVTLTVLLCFLCAACSGDSKIEESVKHTESTTKSPKNDPNKGLGSGDPGSNEDTENDFSMYEGVWLGDEDNLFDDIYIEFDREGYWWLYLSCELADEGFLVYEPVGDYVYVDGVLDSTIEGGQVELEGDRLYITTLGYFSHLVSEDGPYSNNGNGNGYYSWDSELCQRNISEFEGVWYYDGNLSAETYIIIDGDGNWSYYERTPGDPEATEMDHGVLCYSADEVSTYYADSAMYGGVSYRVFEIDEGIISWNDDCIYYRMQ